MKRLDPIRDTRLAGQAGSHQPQKVRKAVLPVAGLGTRFLPVTKALPKEMLPIVDRPLIQYAVDEALAAGIRELIFVTHRSKRVIEDYFDRAIEFERELETRGHHRQVAELRKLAPDHLHIAYARQSAPLGLGHAIHCARHLIGNQPFAVILPNELIDNDPPVMAQMVERYQTTGKSLIGVQTIQDEGVSHHGIVETTSDGAQPERVVGIADTPGRGARGRLGVVGRYVFSPRILDCLGALQPNDGGEIDLVCGIARLLTSEPVYAHVLRGTRYDCGSKSGFLDATLAYAARHPELGPEFRAKVIAMARRLQPARRPTHARANDPASVTLAS
jgi:UTP--glucose-1-phosphate uridylyltransferase